MEETNYDSYKVGELPEGCKKCVLGTKMVLYATGLCPRNCFYCPLSEKRQGDNTFANERPVDNFNEIIEESEKMKAQGAGITGGDPFVKIDRTVSYIKKLKSNFGDNYHIHLYTTGELATFENLERLYEAGLDEIRFHPDLFEDDYERELENIEKALDFGWDVGGEVPILPERIKPLKKYANFLDSIGAKFLNLNELEMAEVNYEELNKRGLRLVSDEGSAVEGSLKTGKEFLKWAEKNTNLDYHLCPSQLKDKIQMENRLIRTAENVKKPYEVVSEVGLLRKVVIKGKSNEKIKETLNKLEVPQEMIGKNSEDEIEIAWWIANDIKDMDLGLEFYFVEEYPTWDKLETFRSPLKDL